MRRSDSESGLGDILLFPLMLNYAVSPDLNVNFRVGLYAPTGDYEVGRLANTGKNFWIVEPTLGVIYFGQKNGRVASLFLGVDFNEENPDTEYKSGTQVHLDGTLAQHFQLVGGTGGMASVRRRAGYHPGTCLDIANLVLTVGDFPANLLDSSRPQN